MVFQVYCISLLMLLVGLRFETQLRLALMKNVAIAEIIPYCLTIQLVDCKYQKLLLRVICAITGNVILRNYRLTLITVRL